MAAEPLRRRPSWSPDRVAPSLHHVPGLLGALVIALQISWPLAGGARDAVTVAVVVAFAASSLTHAALTRGPRTAALVLLVTAGLGFVAELVGVHTGVPFGEYHYAGTLGPELAGVPVVVALAWAMFAWPAALVALRVGRGFGGRVLVGAWSLTAWDLFLDPQMVDAGHWRWADPSPHLPGVPTVPLTNLAGWLAVSLLISAGVQLVLGRGGDRDVAPDDRWPITLFLWTYGSSVLALGVFLGLAGAAFWGALGLGVVVVPLVRSLRAGARAPRRQPEPAGVR